MSVFFSAAFIAEFYWIFYFVISTRARLFWDKHNKHDSEWRKQQQQHQCHVNFYFAAKISQKCVTSYLAVVLCGGCMPSLHVLLQFCGLKIVRKIWLVQWKIHKNFGRIVLLPFIIEKLNGKRQTSNKQTNKQQQRQHGKNWLFNKVFLRQIRVLKKLIPWSDQAISISSDWESRKRWGKTRDAKQHAYAKDE